MINKRPQKWVTQVSAKSNSEAIEQIQQLFTPEGMESILAHYEEDLSKLSPEGAQTIRNFAKAICKAVQQRMPVEAESKTP